MKNLITIIIFAVVFLAGILLDCQIISSIINLFYEILPQYLLILLTVVLWILFSLSTGFIIFLASFFTAIIIRNALKEAF